MSIDAPPGVTPVSLQGKVRVRLYEAGGAGLIFPRATGIIYANQAGGVSCLQPELEGVYVPIGDPDLASGVGLEPELLAHFTGPEYLGGATDGYDAEVIDGLLARAHLGASVRVDRERLAESYESWVYVRVLGPATPYANFSGLGPYPCSAVLTWCNSD